MKRLITASNTDEIEIIFEIKHISNIIINEENNDNKLSAGVIDKTRVTNKNFILPDYIVDKIDGFAQFVLDTINDFGFAIIKQYQAGDTYSYYIEYQPITVDGKKLKAKKFKIRVSDHKSETYDNTVAEDVMITSFIINGKTLHTIPQLEDKTYNIFANLLQGKEDIEDI